YALSTLYQFWIHTELVPKIGGIWNIVFNLPHHHRVHHAVNPQYLDKNYGATLIVWDHLFRTFEDEVEPPVYGLTTPLGSFNPLWAQVHYFFDMHALWKTSRGTEKLGALFRSPAWKPKAYVHPPKRDLAKATYTKFSVYTPKKTQRYVLGSYVVVALATFLLMGFGQSLPRSVLYLGSASIVLALLSLGGMLERKKWAPGVEAIRLVIGGLAVALYVLPKLGLHL
ncbi:MAG: sterol desaturase family protein, partial [Polyangiaceae bacterium]